MSKASDTYVERINRSFQHVPELRSSLVRYPMKLSRWLDPKNPNDKAPDGKPAFAPVAKEHYPKKVSVRYDDVPLKADYAFGAGPKGFGYYHVLTQQAYVILTPRLQAESAPSVCCGCFKRAAEPNGNEAKRADLEEICVIIHHRSKSPVPNDAEVPKYGVEKRYEAYYE